MPKNKKKVGVIQMTNEPNWADIKLKEERRITKGSCLKIAGGFVRESIKFFDKPVDDKILVKSTVKLAKDLYKEIKEQKYFDW